MKTKIYIRNGMGREWNWNMETEINSHPLLFQSEWQFYEFVHEFLITNHKSENIRVQFHALLLIGFIWKMKEMKLF